MFFFNILYFEMNCNTYLKQYKSSSTFTLDNKTYNKVRVTNKWNQIGIRYFDNSIKETKYFNTLFYTCW